MNEYENGKIVRVKVTAIETYGAFVILDHGYTGLIHISEINGRYIDDINNYLRVGEELNARIINVDNDNKQLKLTLKDVNNDNRKLLKDTNLGFLLLKDLLPKWIDDKIKDIQNCK